MEDDLQWKTTSNGRQPPMKDNLKILKVEYLRNHLLDPTPILNLRLDYQKKNPFMTNPYFVNPWNEDNLWSKMTSKYQKGKISAATVWIMTYEFLWGL